MSEPSQSVYQFNRWQLLALALGVLIVTLGATSEGTGERLVFTALFGGLLLLLSVIDARHFILPDVLNAILAVIGLVMVWRLVPGDWMAHLIGGVGGFSALYLVEIIFKRLRGIDGLGRGDAKMLGAIGIWTGWMGLPSVLLIASWFGLAFGGALMLLRRLPDGDRIPIPFGPFLAIGAWIVWFMGPLRLPF